MIMREEKEKKSKKKEKYSEKKTSLQSFYSKIE